jgi:DNA-binding winged helix-turn-helix (wHTH) protein
LGRLQHGCGAVTARRQQVAEPSAGRYLWLRGIGMDFRILGPLEVLDDGRRVALGGAKQRGLLALLVIHANETLSTERLIDELWGERPPATAAKTVQVHISRLRKALERSAAGGCPQMVVTREHGYVLGIDPESVDSHRFERLIIEGRRELVANHPGRAASLLEQALSLRPPSSPATLKPRSHLPDTGEVPRVERPSLRLNCERDPGRRDGDAIDIAAPVVRHRVTQPPPVGFQRCQCSPNLVLGARADAAAARQASPPASVHQQTERDEKQHAGDRNRVSVGGDDR